MKRLLACLALCASLASAQVVYPYNPDANGDSAITSGDLLDFCQCSRPRSRLKESPLMGCL